MRILGEMETKEVKVKNYRKVVSMKCDMCNCELKDFYASIETHHNRWGNDSYESYEYYELCFDCAKKKFNEYLEKPQNTDCFQYEVEHVNYTSIEVQENGRIFDDENFEVKYMENSK